jgi:hypothetical protein
MIKRDTTPIVTQENKQLQTDSMMELNKQMMKLAFAKENSSVKSQRYWTHYLNYMNLHLSRMTDEANIKRCEKTMKMIRMHYLGMPS